MSEQPKSKFELTVELIKATAWPGLTMIILITFWGPLRQTAEQFPYLVRRSDTITIAGLSLEVSRELRRQASPEVEEVITELSKEGIKRVLRLSGGSYWDKGSETHGRADYTELIHLKLVEEIAVDELERQNQEEGKNFGFGVRPTELGRQTQSFLQSVVAEFVQELDLSHPSSSDE